MKKLFRTCLLLVSFAPFCFSQMVIEPKFGPFLHQTTYTYEGQKFHPEYKRPGLGFALAFRNGVGKRFSLGTEIGFGNFHNDLDIKVGNKSVKGDHLFQQAYIGLLPHYALFKKQSPGQIFIKAGTLLFLNTRSEFSDFGGLQPFDVGSATNGFCGGVVGSLKLGKTGLGIQLELRHTIQTPIKDSGGKYAPDRFSLRYTNIFWSLTYHL